MLAGVLLGVPALALADIDVSNSGSVYSSTNASANSGGQTAGGGESVITGGAKASSHSTTIIEGGEDGGTVEIETTTEVNGEVKQEVIKKDIPPGGVNIQTSVTADSTAGSASSSVTVNGEVATGSTPASTSASIFFGGLWEGFLNTLGSIFWFW